MLVSGPQYLGDFVLSALVELKFTTFAAATGAPTTLAGTPAVSVYKGSNITEDTGGVTLTVDFDGRTGMHHVTIDTSSSGAFYTTGSEFQIVITTGTVGGTSVVGYVIGSFSLLDRSALRPTVAGRTLDVSAGGEAGLDWGNVGAPTTANALTGTTISSAQVVASVSGAVGSVTGAVGSVTGNVGGNVTGSVGSVVGNVGGNLGGTLTSTERLAIADALLTRDQSLVSPQPALNAKCPLNALRMLRFWSIGGTTLTVFKEDGTTIAWSGTATLNAGAVPVTGIG